MKFLKVVNKLYIGIKLWLGNCWELSKEAVLHSRMVGMRQQSNSVIEIFNKFYVEWEAEAVIGIESVVILAWKERDNGSFLWFGQCLYLFWVQTL